MSITSLIAEHPYATGGIIIGGGVLFIVLRSAGGSKTASAPAGGGAPAANPNVQIAGIQAGSALQTQNNAIRQQTNQQGFQLTAQAQQLQASIAGLQIQTSVQTSGEQKYGLAHEQLSNDFTLGTQKLTNEHDLIVGNFALQGAQIEADLKRTRITTAASVANNFNDRQTETNLAVIQANRDVTISGQNNDTSRLAITTQGTIEAGRTAAAVEMQNGINLTSFAIAHDANNTAVTTKALDTAALINGQNVAGTVAITQSNNSTDVAKTYITTAGSIATAGINAQRATESDVIKLISSGQINKGGEGGANQVSVLGGVLGYPGIGGPAQATAGQPGNTPGGIIASIGGAASGILGKVFA